MTAKKSFKNSAFINFISKFELINFGGKRNIHIIDLVSYLLCLLFIIAGALVSLNRYFQYDVYYYDFGIFDQAIWNVSRLHAPIMEHLAVGGKWIFADHFSPSIFLLSPLYWITSRQEVLLIAQALIVGLSGLFIYKIGKELLKDRFLSFSILVCYFLFAGLQNAVITDFHEVTIMTLPLVLIFWAIIKKKIKWYFFFLILTLGFKESTFLLGIGIGISLLFIRKEWIKISALTIIISIVWGILSIKLIIPYFSGGIYQYEPVLPKGVFDKINAFYDNPIKIRTLFYSFFNFGFLPILSPAFWLLILQDFATRFLSTNWGTRFGLGLHYSAQITPILALSSLYAFNFLKKIKRVNKYLFIVGIALIINSFILYRFTLRAPFALAYNPAFYKHSENFTFLNDIIKKIPGNSSVMAQNNLAARFAHQKVWILRENYFDYMPDYIIFDMREGQNPNNFFPIVDNIKMISFLEKDPNYELYYKTNQQFIFKKVNKNL